eukprot:TRINITY_DN28647_c0_g1_i1.p1 TRINITY_DN28647_c0_g1~~TRINITY_DN28647_c0_g1_i1.p1  ORF type:complete len:111 (+),score=9.93 TRINITY_DN28647_c0_g1_i1:1781-2113(+)
MNIARLENHLHLGTCNNAHSAHRNGEKSHKFPVQPLRAIKQVRSDSVLQELLRRSLPRVYRTACSRGDLDLEQRTTDVAPNLSLSSSGSDRISRFESYSLSFQSQRLCMQ